MTNQRMEEQSVDKRTVDADSDEGMLREAHDLLALAMSQWRNAPTPWAWLAADLKLRLDERFPTASDVTP